MSKQKKDSSKTKKDLELGDIEVIDLSKELSAEDFDIYFNSAGSSDELASYLYMTTSSCSDSCSGSTFCC